MGAVREMLALLAAGRSDEMTNADMIRHMTDEQLAVWLCMITAPRCDGKKKTRLIKWYEWLKQEAEK